MLKLWVRNTLLFFVVVAISVFSGWCAYTVTRTLRQEEYAAQVSAAGAEENADDINTQNAADGAGFEYYTVRLEGEKIFVYASKENREEILYSVDVYLPDLPESDRTLLKSGVRLETSPALTAFMENYTS